MKTAMTVEELGRRVMSVTKTKEDYIVQAKQINLDVIDRKLSMQFGNVEPLTINRVAHRQISNYTGIPKNYYEKMLDRDAVDLLRENVNHWFKSSTDNRLVRTLDGINRAFLSDKYKIIDNFDAMNAVMPVLNEQPGLLIPSAEFNDERLYIKAVFPKMENEVRKGDVVQAGICISNSEVGCGAFRVEPLIFRLVCSNGLILEDYRMRKFHSGARKNIMGDEDFSIYSRETVEKDNEVFMLKARDLVRQAFNQVFFEEQVEKMRKLTGIEIREPQQAIKKLSNTFQLTENDEQLVLNAWFKESDLTAYGLMNAVTRASQDDSLSYEEATRFERIGGNIMELDPTQWSVVN